MGSALARNLKDKYPSYTITVCDNLVRRGSEINLPGLKERGIEFFHTDLRLEADIQDLPPSDIIIDASADPSVLAGINSSVTKLIQSNLTSTTNLLDWASRHQSRFIFLSTSRIYPIEKLNQIVLEEGNTRFEVAAKQTLQGISRNGISENFPLEGSRSFYGAAKLASELFVEEYKAWKNLQTVTLRCGVIAGPGQFGKVDQGILVHWLASHFWKRNLAYFGFGGTGKQVRDFLHILDLVNLIDQIIHRFDLLNGKTINAGGGTENSISLQELTTLCQNVTGNTVNIESVKNNRAADIPYYCTDNALIQNCIGWKPERKISDLIKDTALWIESNNAELKKIL